MSLLFLTILLTQSPAHACHNAMQEAPRVAKKAKPLKTTLVAAADAPEAPEAEEPDEAQPVEASADTTPPVPTAATPVTALGATLGGSFLFVGFGSMALYDRKRKRDWATLVDDQPEW